MSAKPPVVPTLEVRLPDLGTPGEVTVLELLVRVGDQVEKEQALLTLESEKATMDVPATAAGKVARILVKAGDKVSSGTAVLELEGPHQIPARRGRLSRLAASLTSTRCLCSRSRSRRSTRLRLSPLPQRPTRSRLGRRYAAASRDYDVVVIGAGPGVTPRRFARPTLDSTWP